MFKCMSCGKELGWCSDFNLDEVYPEEVEEYEGGCVGIYQCGHCDLDYEITTYNNSDDIRVIFYERED